MDYTVHGILQARILEWVAALFSRGSSQPRDWTWVSCIADGLLHCRQILYHLRQRNLVSYNPRGRRVRHDWMTKLTTEWLSLHARRQYSIVYMYHIFFIHSSVNGHLGCFHVLAIMNSAAMNIGVHMPFSITFFSGYRPVVGLLGNIAD